MTPDELRPILAEYRKRVSAAWSKATAHPDHDAADGSPVGQCGVTSAWLQERLWADHMLVTTYCIGHVYTGFSYRSSPEHCWLELDGIVIDLTADQLDVGQPVLCEESEILRRRLIDYISVTRFFTLPSEDTDLRRRLALVYKALS